MFISARKKIIQHPDEDSMVRKNIIYCLLYTSLSDTRFKFKDGTQESYSFSLAQRIIGAELVAKARFAEQNTYRVKMHGKDIALIGLLCRDSRQPGHLNILQSTVYEPATIWTCVRAKATTYR